MRRPPSLSIQRCAVAVLVGTAACAAPSGPYGPELEKGVVFTYPVDRQLDVPTGAKVIVSFSDAGMADEAALQIVGPNGPIELTTSISAAGKTIEAKASAMTAFDPGTEYAVYVGGSTATGDALFRFTTRSDRPRSGAPRLIAINGSDPSKPGELRPILETSTIQLVFSEPIDPRSFAGGTAMELVDAASGAPVPVRWLHSGIHASLDPIERLVPDTTYELRLTDAIRDLGGEPLAVTTVPFSPRNSLGRGAIQQTFRTRRDGDPIADIARTDVANAIELAHPMIGTLRSAMRPSVVASELGDPMALGGPIAFTIPSGQRLASESLAVLLGGDIASGLDTGDIMIEILAEANGRLYRNRYQDADVLPDNARSPLHVDLTLDLGIYATDPVGASVLSQTVLGVQVSGVAMADHGTLAIETLGAMDVGLLGIAKAPANLVLDLVAESGGTAVSDTTPPTLLGTLPDGASRDLSPENGIELIFDEPIDIDAARGGGIELVDNMGSELASTIELHGSAVVVRPRDVLPSGVFVYVALAGVADVAGNLMPPRRYEFGTPSIPSTTAPPSTVSIYPGTACPLVDSGTATAGRCAGGRSDDDTYQPFSLASNQQVEVAFDQVIAQGSLVLGIECGTGSVRIERVGADGACTGVVSGALLRRQRGLSFLPDTPWLVGERYRLVLVSGTDATCSDGEICGANGKPASFDALRGKTANASGGPDLAIDFVGAAPTSSTGLFADVAPYTDLNASGFIESGESSRTENSVALQITGTSGVITGASFPGESRMYMLGAMPAELGEARSMCSLPDGTVAPSCVPVRLSAQQMYATSVKMTAAALGIPITTDTGISVMRVREPKTGPLEGFIVERDGKPEMVVALDLYMDAPDMSLPIGEHDMHSKSLSVMLSGPMRFRPDGRIAISLSNAKELPITVGISAMLGIGGTVNLVVPAGQMKLQLLSRPQRGAIR